MKTKQDFIEGMNESVGDKPGEVSPDPIYYHKNNMIPRDRVEDPNLWLYSREEFLQKYRSV